MILDNEKLTELTGYTRNDYRIKELNFLGINHKVRSDGFPVVLENALDPAPKQKSNKGEPKWEHI